MPNCNCNQRERMARSCNSNYSPGSSDCDLSNMPIAMAYVPWQHFDTVYEVDKALGCGTIFPELYKPFLGKRGVHR